MPALLFSGRRVLLLVLELLGEVLWGQERQHQVRLAADAPMVAASTTPMDHFIAGGTEVFDAILAMNKHLRWVRALLSLAFFADCDSEVAVAGKILAGLGFTASFRRHRLFHVHGELGVQVFIGQLRAVAKSFWLEY